MRAVTGAILALILIPLTAAAQSPIAPVDDPEATLLTDLLVIAPTEGPAWWRISKGDSVVWIMGLPESVAPKGLKWDRTALNRRMTGAQALLTPPTVNLAFPVAKKVGAAEFTPALSERFAAARTRIKKPAKRYAGAAPVLASLMLYRDYLQSAKLLERGEALRWVKAIARARRVPIVQPTAIQGGKLEPAQMDPGRPEAAACYEALIQATEVPVERYRAVAAGWARGDLKTASSGPRNPFGICENRLFNAGASRRAIEVQVADIEAALNKPGKTVAVANLRRLLADEGILDRLAADGYKIIYPAGLDDAE